MHKTMKAAVVREFGKPLVIEEMRVPMPGPGQILVKIAATGVCHTDLHAAQGDWPVKPKPPFIPGHEGVGHVVAVGAGVTHVREGDRVGVPWLYTACGHCVHCLGGWETLCEEQQNTGYSVNGSFAEYVLADPNYVGHLPDNIGFIEISPVLCAGVTVYKGLKVTDTKPGDWSDLRHRRPRSHGGAICQGYGIERRRGGYRRCQAQTCGRIGCGTHRQRQQDRSDRVHQEGDWWRAGSAGHRGVTQGLQPGARHGQTRRYRRAQRPAAGRLPVVDFRYRAEWDHRAGLDPGTRLDLQESLDFAAQGKVRATVTTESLANINDVFGRMARGEIEGRVVLDFEAASVAAKAELVLA